MFTLEAVGDACGHFKMIIVYNILHLMQFSVCLGLFFVLTPKQAGLVCIATEFFWS